MYTIHELGSTIGKKKSGKNNIIVKFTLFCLSETQDFNSCIYFAFSFMLFIKGRAKAEFPFEKIIFSFSFASCSYFFFPFAMLLWYSVSNFLSLQFIFFQHIAALFLVLIYFWELTGCYLSAPLSSYDVYWIIVY